MLSRIITHLTAHCPRHLRRMGYLSEVVNIRERHRRCHGDWTGHLEKTRRVVTDAAASCSNRGRVVVLGSGLLLDLPLEVLADTFDEVLLVDILHLPEVSRRIRPYRNVRTLQCDITGVAHELFQGRRVRPARLPLGRSAIPAVDDTTGLVISLNILSQLSVMPSSFVRRHMPGIDAQELGSWGNGIGSTHYSALKALPCPVCLVADYRALWRDKEGTVIDERSTVGTLPLPEPDSSWTWKLAPVGEASRHCSKELLVGAWSLPSS